MHSTQVRPDSNARTDALAPHRQAVERVIAEMRARSDGALPLRAMAEIACLSPYHFSRVFRGVTGAAPGEFLSALRLERAKRLLLTTDLSVTDVCFEVGYDSVGTFTTRFTQLVGLSPGRVRLLPEVVGPTLPSPHDAYPLFPPVPAGPLVRGTVHAPEFAGGLIFVGLFASGVPQRRPAAGALLEAPGEYSFAVVPDGRYHLMSAALPPAGDALGYLLPGDALRVGRAPGTLLVHAGLATGCKDVTLRPMRRTDPPVLVALPALLLDLSGVGRSPRR